MRTQERDGPVCPGLAGDLLDLDPRLAERSLGLDRLRRVVVADHVVRDPVVQERLYLPL